MAGMSSNPMRKLLASPFVAGLLVSSCVFALCVDDAMAQRGGGGRGGGGGAGASRGGGGGGGGSHGGRQAKSSVSSSNRSGGGGGSRASAGGDTANRSGNTANRSTTTNRTNNSSRNTNIGSNNNVNINRGDVNIDVDGGYGGYGNNCCRARYPIAAGVAIGAVAGMTAAAVGSYYYGLPSGCGQIVRGGIGYYQCGSAYYQQSMNGDQVVYVSVNP